MFLLFICGNFHNNFTVHAENFHRLLEDKRPPAFNVFRATVAGVCGSVQATTWPVVCFSSSGHLGLFKRTFSLRNSHTKESGGVRSRDQGDQQPRSTVQGHQRTLAVNTIELAFPQLCGAYQMSKLLEAGHAAWHKYFLSRNLVNQSV
jgi:hypothetical protein